MRSPSGVSVSAFLSHLFLGLSPGACLREMELAPKLNTEQVGRQHHLQVRPGVLPTACPQEMPKPSRLCAFAQAVIQGKTHKVRSPVAPCVTRVWSRPARPGGSSTSHKYQARELALSVELGLASESSQFLCSPANLSKDGRFTETFSSF